MKKILLIAFSALLFLGCQKDEEQPADSPVVDNVSGEFENGILPGRFSISDGRQIRFSMGNLQYQPATHTWRFAEQQYFTAYHQGEENSSSQSNPSYVDATADYGESSMKFIDLFGWGTSGYSNPDDAYCANYQPNSIASAQVDMTYNYYGYGPSSNMTDKNLTGTSAEYDWGIHNAISNGGNRAGMWRTLTIEEWDYLSNGRPNASLLKGLGFVDGTYGLILLPDDWDQPAGASFDPSADSNNYTPSQWEAMQLAGAVFLPAAGSRFGCMVNYMGVYGGYWSSSAFTDNINARYFFISSTMPGDASYKYYRCAGHSVRLVTEQ